MHTRFAALLLSSGLVFGSVSFYRNICLADVHPNIVVLLADDMGLGDTSAYQDWTSNDDASQLSTPAMERLARQGVRFTQAHSPHSRCTTTRYALLTGRYCWRTRLKHWVLFGVHGDPLIDRERMTLPEFLQSAGYRTGMVGKWHLGLGYRDRNGEPAAGWSDADLTQPLVDGPLDHGFDFFYGMSRSHGTSGPDGAKGNTTNQAIGPGWINGRKVIGATGDGKRLDGSYVLSQVGNVLDRKASWFLKDAVLSSSPFFLYFASPANHTPYTPSNKIGDTPVASASRFCDGKPAASKRHDFIFQNDVHLERLLSFLDNTPDPRRGGRPLRENTIVVFASDNGADKPDKVFTGPLRSNKGSVYEGGHRIPLIISWPLGGIGDGNDATPGQTSSGVLGLNDLYATFAEAINVPLPRVEGTGRGAEDSVSRLAIMKGEPSERRPPLFANDHKEASENLSDERAWVALITDQSNHPDKQSAAVNAATDAESSQWKLLLDHRYAYDGQVNPRELYNLTVDPEERMNRLDDPSAKEVLEELIQHAQRCASDNGYSRPR